MRTLHQYQAPGLLATEQGDGTTINTRALLFYEGEHTPGSGRGKKFTKASLQKIADATNAYLSGGRRVKLFMAATDHRVGQQAAIGLLDGDITLARITSTDLPLPGLTDLVGKFGLFGHVSISASEAVSQYKSGLLKELSIGLGGDNVIYEISAVSIPSLTGAALFALTLPEQVTEDSAEQRYEPISSLFDSFLDVLASIDEATPEELGDSTPDELRAQAVKDLASHLQAGLKIPAPQEPLPALPTFSAQPMNTEEKAPAVIAPDAYQAQLDELKAQLAASQAQLQFSSQRTQSGDRFSELRRKGEELRLSGKLTPAAFTELFEADIPSLETFSAAPADAVNALSAFDAKLSGLAFHLEQLEKHGSAVSFGLPVAAQDGTTPADDVATFAADFVSKNLPKVSYR